MIVPSKKEEHIDISALELPKEFISLSNEVENKIAQIEAKHALKFLKKRGITQDDIIKYNIGFCKEGKYEYRVIIPSYDSLGKLNYFIARDYKEPSLRKYKNPPTSAKDVIGWELYINWDAPIILVEPVGDVVGVTEPVGVIEPDGEIEPLVVTVGVTVGADGVILSNSNISNFILSFVDVPLTLKPNKPKTDKVCSNALSESYVFIKPSSIPSI